MTSHGIFLNDPIMKNTKSHTYIAIIGHMEKRFAGVVLSALLSFGYASAVQCDQLKIDWGKISRAYEAYLDDSSSDNAEALVNSLPRIRVGYADLDPFEEFEKALDIIFSSRNYKRFMEKIGEGDKSAIIAATRIFNFADGGNAESIFIILGDAVRDHPKLFLEVMYENRDYQGIDNVVGPAVMTRYEMGSEEERREYNARLGALRSVDEEKYKDLRDACIREILKALKSQKSNAGALVGN